MPSGQDSPDRGHTAPRRPGAAPGSRTGGASASLAAFLVLMAPPADRPAFPAPSQGGGTARSDAVVEPTGYTSARVCGQCHADIYASWKNSLHAYSLTDPIFDSAYMQALKAAGDGAKRLCLRCHAPMTMSNGDYELRQGVTREGVSCDFCHTVTAVHLGDVERPYSLEPGRVKRGIIKKAASPAHEVAFSELHGSSEFCGGCHNYKAPNGTPILGTYDEWRQGPYAREGIQCQDCHMVLTTGNVVSEEIKKSRGEIHLHDLIHDTDQLRSALTLRIARAERTAHGLQVDVEVENVGSGHMVPTGIPTREIVLSVTAAAAGRTLSQERRFSKVVADAEHRVLTLDFEVLLYGAAILNDTRIAPREKRLERFTFDLPRSHGARVTATLSYVYTPLVLKKQPINLKLGQAERAVY